MSDQKKTVFGYAPPSQSSSGPPQGSTASSGDRLSQVASNREAPQHSNDVPQYGQHAQQQQHGQHAQQYGGSPQHQLAQAQQHYQQAPQHYQQAPQHGGSLQHHQEQAPQHYQQAPQQYQQAPQHGGSPQHQQEQAQQHYQQAPQHYGYEQGQRPQVSPVKTGFYVTMVLMSLVGFAMLGLGSTDSKLTELLPFSILPLLVAGIVNLVLLYKAWAAIQDGYQRTRPGAAVGLLFVPIFSLYWMFIAYGAWGRNFNAFAQRHGVDFRVSEGLFTVHCVLMLVGGPLSLITAIMMTVAMCRGINAIAYRSAGGIPVARIANR